MILLTSVSTLTYNIRLLVRNDTVASSTTSSVRQARRTLHVQSISRQLNVLLAPLRQELRCRSQEIIAASRDVGFAMIPMGNGGYLSVAITRAYVGVTIAGNVHKERTVLDGILSNKAAVIIM
jgi:hypothetical protein